MTSVSSSMFTGLISTMSIDGVSKKIAYKCSPRTETLIANVQVPQVDTKVVRRNVCFLVRIDRYGMDVVRMRIRVDLPRYSCDDVVLRRHTWKFQAVRSCRWWQLALTIKVIGLGHHP